MAVPVRQYFDFLTSRGGFSPIAAAGILGNIEQESGFDPGRINADEGAVGLAQWRQGRRGAMQDHVARSGLPPALAQLDFLAREVDQFKGLRQRLNAAKTPEEAAQLFGKEYERPKVVEQARLTNARNLYAGLADPSYSGARGMTAERAQASDAQPKRLRVSDVLAPEAAPKAAPAPEAKRLRVSDVLPDATPPQESLPPPERGQDFITGGTMEEGATPPPSRGMGGAFDDATRGATALPGMDHVRALGGATGDYLGDKARGLMGKPQRNASFSDLYRENLAREEGLSAQAAAEPGLGGVDLPLGLGRLNANPYLAGNVVGGLVTGKYLPTFGLEKMRYLGGTAAGAVQGGEMALAQLMAGAAGNKIANNDWMPPPSDIGQALGYFGGGVLGGAVGDLAAKIGGHVARNARVQTPELREDPRVGNALLRTLQEAGETQGATQALNALERRAQTGTGMLADYHPALAGAVENAGIKNAGTPAYTVPQQRFEARRAQGMERVRALIGDVWSGNIDEAISDLRMQRNAKANANYEAAGVPRFDRSAPLPEQQKVTWSAPDVPLTPAMRDLLDNPRYQAMVKRIQERDPQLFSHVVEEPFTKRLAGSDIRVQAGMRQRETIGPRNLILMDQAYKNFTDGLDPFTGVLSKSDHQLRAMIRNALKADPSFKEGQFYAKALGDYAGDKALEEATQLGRRAGNLSADDYDALKRMADVDKEAARIGAAAALADKLKENITPKQVANILGNQRLRRDLGVLLGKDDFQGLSKEVLRLAREERLNQAFTSNSRTAQRIYGIERDQPSFATAPALTRQGLFAQAWRKVAEITRPAATDEPIPRTTASALTDLLTRVDPRGQAQIIADLRAIAGLQKAKRPIRKLAGTVGARALGGGVDR